MSEAKQSAPQTSQSASEMFRSADKTQQRIIEAVLREERQVMHQKHRTKIFDNIVGIIKEHVQ
jgi:L-serine deaminase